eukprot:Platyproteum_vivax@DN7218_c0_g2_i1.p1
MSEWRCDTCKLKNKAGSVKCQVCQAPNPNLSKEKCEEELNRVARLFTSTNENTSASDSTFNVSSSAFTLPATAGAGFQPTNFGVAGSAGTDMSLLTGGTASATFGSNTTSELVEDWAFQSSKLKRLNSRPWFRKGGRLIEAGEVYVHGSGECDQLGLGPDFLERRKPTLIKGLTKVYKICVGSLHTVALTTDRRVFSWGCNDDCSLGRLGEENTPGEIEEFRGCDVSQLACGDSHSAVLVNGQCYLWGSYKTSECYLGFPDYSSPINKGASVASQKEVVPQAVKQLGGQDLPYCVELTSRGNFTAILGEDGNVWIWGSNEQGQLGNDEKYCVAHLFPQKRTPEDLGLKNAIVANLWSYSYGLFVQLIPPFVPSTSMESALLYNLMNLASKPRVPHRIYACGLNNFGQLGVGHTNFVKGMEEVTALRDVPVEYICGGEMHCCALTTYGTVYSW